MDHFFSTYGGLLIPGAVALVLLLLVLKIANAIFRLVGLVVLIALLVGGYLVYGRVMDMQKAAEAAVHHGRPTAAARASAVDAPARQAIAKAGLNPAFLRVHVVCAGPDTRVQLRYADKGFLFGVLSHQTFDVPLGNSARC